MIRKTRPFRKNAGYSLVELMVALGLLGLVGGAIYTVLNDGMIFYAKNVATNYSSLVARTASTRMVRDLHNSIGPAALVGTNLQPVATATAPGIRYPVLLNDNAVAIISNSAGSKSIKSSGNPASDVSLRIPQQTKAPKVGDILIFPDINENGNGGGGLTLCRKITAVTLGNPTTVTVKDLMIDLEISTDIPPDPTIVFIARSAAYTVESTPRGTELRFYPDAAVPATYTVVANNLEASAAADAGPFSIDGNNSVKMQFITTNPDTGERGFKGDRMMFSEVVPPKTLILQSNVYK